MPLVALIAYLAFVGVAVGWRSWLQQRRTGDAGFRAFRGGARELVASALFVAGFGAAPLGPLAVLFGWQLPARVHPALHAAGLLGIALGFWLTIRAQLAMGASWRIGVDPREQTALVTRGVFAHVRNPIFTGILLVLSGLFLLVPGAVAGAALLCTWIALELQVRGVEEPYLLRTHGEAYRAYTRRAGRFLPLLGRMR